MSFIERVLKEKEKEIVRRMERTSLRDLKRMLGDGPVRDFSYAISGRGKIIAEIKAKSPCSHSYRSSLMLHDLPVIYEENGASAISVVTDTLNFGITLEEARSLRAKTTLPMLVKDFIIDPYQVLAARAFHADAILLIARILSTEKLASLRTLARQLGMHAIVEVHSTSDLAKAILVKAEIIGINNRDLDTLIVDTETTQRLITGIPPGVITVSESGISTRKEIEPLIDMGINAFLIGTALLDSPHPGFKLRELAGMNGGNN